MYKGSFACHYKNIKVEFHGEMKSLECNLVPCISRWQDFEKEIKWKVDQAKKVVILSWPRIFLDTFGNIMA